MLEVAKQMVRQENGDLFVKENLSLLDDILREMQDVTSASVDTKTKFQAITTFCLDYGLCCLETGRCVKAKEIYEN